MTLTQQIWSLKHFCQVFIHQDNQTFLKPVLLAMLEKLLETLFIYYIRSIITIRGN